MEKIFYYRHTNNEIYQLKFKRVLIRLDGEEVRNVLSSLYMVEYIQAEVAGLGLMEWRRNGRFHDEVRLRPQNIFDSVEKAVACKNVNTLGCVKGSEDVFHVNFIGWKWDCSFLDFDDFTLPENVFSVTETNVFGQRVMRIKTYVWNGVKAVEKGYIGDKSPYDVSILSGCVTYDVINNQCFIADEYRKNGYTTAEECTNNNAIKVHCFAC